MDQFIIIKSDGSSTDPMLYDQANHYLQNLIEGQQRDANLSQALTTVLNGNGLPTGNYIFRNRPVRHASAGQIGVSSVSLFFIDQNGDHYIFAMGRHAGQQGGHLVYRISDYGQPVGDFRLGAMIVL